MLERRADGRVEMAETNEQGNSLWLRMSHDGAPLLSSRPEDGGRCATGGLFSFNWASRRYLLAAGGQGAPWRERHITRRPPGGRRTCCNTGLLGCSVSVYERHGRRIDRLTRHGYPGGPPSPNLELDTFVLATAAWRVSQTATSQL